MRFWNKYSTPLRSFAVVAVMVTEVLSIAAGTLTQVIGSGAGGVESGSVAAAAVADGAVAFWAGERSRAVTL